MNSENWQKIKTTFNEAVELAPDKCEAFLQNQNGADKEILAEVRKLLAAEQQNNFAEPVANLSHLWQEDAAEDFLDRQIGNYKITKEIGRGGMGIVFEALRDTPDFSQTVALKLLKRGMDSEAMLRRFRSERQILASLEHPNIARLLDGGMTDDGVQFFALEYVKGQPINDYCNERNLSVNARLRLFLQVCAAVSFAHSRLVVHRDLKPSNILVTTEATIKLLDFGIAKILSPANDFQNQTVTSLGMMTPAYASPEQIKGEIVSTSSDIYSLGLILYELLTGAQAYNFPNKRPDEIAKIVCEIEPPRPSSVISQHFSANGKTADNEDRTANNGHTTNPKSKLQYTKSLKGDLDTIILKALRKEPSRRYASVEQFANDIKRHLDGLPVIARPDTFSYRFEKFIARNKISVIAGILIFFSLIGGITATIYQAKRAEQQRILAEKRFGEVRELANNSVFKYYDQIKDLQGATEARETLLKDAAVYLDRLAEDSGNDPVLQKDLINAYFRLGDILGAPHDNANTGDTAAALEKYQKAQTIAEKLLKQNAEDWEIKGKLRAIHTKTGEIFQRMNNAEETKNHFRATLELSEQIAAHEPDSPKQLSALGQSYVFYGETLPLGAGENESVTISSKAFPYLEKALGISSGDSPSLQRLNLAHIRIGLQLYNLARDADEIGDQDKSVKFFEQTEEHFRKAIETADRLLKIDDKNAGFQRRLFISEFNLSTALSGLGKTGEALEIQRKILADTETGAKEISNAEAQFDYAQANYEIGQTYLRRREFAEAEIYIGKALTLYDQIIARDAENAEVQTFRFEARLRLGDVFRRQENFSKAVEIYRSAFDEAAAAPKLKDSPFTGFANGWTNLKIGDALAAQGNTAAACENYKKAFESWRKNSPEDYGHSAEMLKSLTVKTEKCR